MKSIKNAGSFELIFVIGVFTFGAQITSGLLTCDITDTDAELGQCLTNLFLELNSTWRSGIPLLNIPPMDPFGFAGISVDTGSALVDLEASCSDVTVTGVSQLTSVAFVVNTTAHTLKCTIAFPLIRLEGQYSAAGNLIPILPLSQLTPITGSGGFWFNFVGFQVIDTCQLRNETDGTTTFMALYNCVVGLTITDYSFEFENIGGSSVSALAINSLLNLGKNVIFQQAKPEIDSKLGELTLSTFNPFFSTQPYLSGILKP